MMTLCTLFNVNYLDKGIVLYESLEKVSNDFILYVLAMDDKCYEVLHSLNFKHLIPIKMSDFEDDELKKVKKQRSVGEYCWTCSSSLIRYILMTYNPEYCTYIDADLYFYSDPYVIIEEMKEKKASVQVIGHRFNKKVREYQEWLVGKYCVEFNTFKNDENGLALLNLWRNQCIEHCSIDGDGVYWGDQKYLDNWVNDYNFVIETDNLGAGIAPWNVMQYKEKKGKLWYNGLPVNMLFYHFENIQYVSSKCVRTNVQNISKADFKFIKSIYKNYLLSIKHTKEILKIQYGIDIVIKNHPGVSQDESLTGITKIYQIVHEWIKDRLYLVKF